MCQGGLRPAIVPRGCDTWGLRALCCGDAAASAALTETLAQALDTAREEAGGSLCCGICARPASGAVLQEALEAGGASGAPSLPPQALQERALTEATAYAIRIDVAEELARLGAHLEEIERLLRAGGEVGKRLDFLIQELQREANTLGSKSAALELTHISVDMKVLVEQMREQVQNIE